MGLNIYFISCDNNTKPETFSELPLSHRSGAHVVEVRQPFVEPHVWCAWLACVTAFCYRCEVRFVSECRRHNPWKRMALPFVGLPCLGAESSLAYARFFTRP